MFRIVVAPLLALSLAGVAVPVLAQSRGATTDGVERTDASDDFYCEERRLGQWFYCSKPKPAEQERQVSAGPQRSSVERMEAITCQLEELKAKVRSEEYTTELQLLLRISQAVFCLKKKKKQHPVQYMIMFYIHNTILKVLLLMHFIL